MSEDAAPYGPERDRPQGLQVDVRWSVSREGWAFEVFAHGETRGKGLIRIADSPQNKRRAEWLAARLRDIIAECDKEERNARP